MQHITHIVNPWGKILLSWSRNSSPRNPKVHYLFRKITHHWQYHEQMYPVHTSYSICFIFPSTHWFCKWTLLSGFQTKLLYALLTSHPCYTPHRSHCPLYVHPNKYLVKGKNYEPSHYLTFSSFPFSLSYVEISSSASCFQTRSLYILILTIFID
jgi:hypothetical protein